MPEFYTVYRTASLKLHHPSRRKREVLEHALTEYTLAYQALLEWARENQEQLEAGGKYENRRGDLVWSGRNLAGVLRQAGIKPNVHSSLCDALYNDVSENLLSYYALQEDYEERLVRYEERKAEYEQAGDADRLKKLKEPAGPSWPISRDPSPGAFSDALDGVGEIDDRVDETEWRRRQSHLTRLQRGRYMPLFFSRPDGVPKNRNFSLLADDERGKYYALLFLLPHGHELGQPIDTFSNLRRVGWPAGQDPADYTPPHLNLSPRARSAILCPLKMGRWHVEEFFDHPYANVRTAYLFERSGDYFLNVAFEFTVPAIEPETVIGVDRGLAQLGALVVLDFEGNELYREMWSGEEFLAFQWERKKEIRRLQKRGKDVTGERAVRRLSDHTTHEISRRIADLALEYKAQVVLENLRGFDRRKEKFYRLRAAPYQTIAQKLDYKLPMRGLPTPALVSPAYTSLMCSRCAFQDKGNRPDQATFVCGSCGHTDHADLNAAINIALRWLHRQQGMDWYPPNVIE